MEERSGGGGRFFPKGKTPGSRFCWCFVLLVKKGRSEDLSISGLFLLFLVFLLVVLVFIGLSHSFAVLKNCVFLGLF